MLLLTQLMQLRKESLKKSGLSVTIQMNYA